MAANIAKHPNLTLTPFMGSQVINHLQALGNLPDHGYLAGQAVSSAVFDLLMPWDHGLAVYNDLDVFYDATIDDHKEVAKKSRTLSTVRFQSWHVEEEYGFLNFGLRTSYEVVRSYREGLVNKVAIQSLYPQWPDTRLQCLLKGFDLNCTQVGVDLSTGVLEWTPAFERFVATKQLLISNAQTPHHTAMRWFKKRRELPGAYGNDETAMELISLMSFAKGPNGIHQRFMERENIRWRFGAKTAEMHKTFKQEIAPYFDLIQEPPGFFVLDAKQQPDDHVIAVAKRYPIRAIPHMFNVLRTARKLAKMARINPIIEQGVDPVTKTLGLRLASLLDQGDAYLAGNVDAQRLAEVETFSKSERKVLVPTLWRLSAVNQIKEAVAWKELERSFGRWIYGYIETQMSRHGLRAMSAAEWEFEIEESYIQGFGLDDILTKKPRLEFVEGDYTCRELITRRELMEEGESLHHCVGGYAREVHNGGSRIFQVRHPDKRRWSTVEVMEHQWESSEVAMGKFFVAQHFSFCNTSPHDDTQAIEKAILEACKRQLQTPQVIPILTPEIRKSRWQAVSEFLHNMFLTLQ